MSDADELLTLLRAFRQGDAAAFERLIDCCRPRLVAMLRRSHVYLPREVVEDAAIDALFALYEQPERYQAGRGGLLNYLKVIADFKIMDWMRKVRREKITFVGGNVELELWEANNYREEAEAPDLWHDPDALSQEFLAILAEILPDSIDQQIAALISQGRMNTADIAALLGLAGQTAKQQKAEAKRHRDRIMKKLQRRRDDFRRLYE